MCQSHFLFCKTPQHKACGHEGTILCSLLLLLLRELLSHRAGTGEKVLVWECALLRLCVPVHERVHERVHEHVHVCDMPIYVDECMDQRRGQEEG